MRRFRRKSKIEAELLSTHQMRKEVADSGKPQEPMKAYTGNCKEQN